MKQAPHFTGDERPELAQPRFMLRWEQSQNGFLLLYPEGVVKLSDTAGAILSRCTGEKSITQILDELTREYAGEGIEDSARNFLGVCHENGWIRLKA